uniref:Uncharacterized protein n=1 Tax=Xiphophorus couchianus TaxID=32473 RepID=A0A3B5LNK5_9TELE
KKKTKKNTLALIFIRVLKEREGRKNQEGERNGGRGRMSEWTRFIPPAPEVFKTNLIIF